MKYKLLIVEDEIMIRQGLICAVDWKTMGITEIQEASNGAEGVEKVKSFHPDIVITDICMPIVSGLDLIKQTLAEYHYIPIIISGYSDFEYAQTAIEFGVTAFLLKPIDIEKLQEAVEKAKVELYKQNLLKDYSASRQDFIHASYIPAPRQGYSDIVQGMLDFVSASYSEKITLGIIAQHLHYSENFILRKFKEEMQMNFSEYLARYRISKAIEMIRTTDRKLPEIAEICGFSEYKYFRNVFARYVGCTPKEFAGLLNEDRFFAKKH